MHAATVGYDVDAFARIELKRVEASNNAAERMTKGLGLLVRGSSKMVADLFGAAIGSVLVYFIQKEILRARGFTHVFRGLRDDLRHAVAATGEYPDQGLIEQADRLQWKLEELKQVVLDTVFGLRKLNEGSRVATSLEKFAHEVTELQGAIYRYRLVAIGADGVADRTWEEEVAAGRTAFLHAANRLDDMSEEGIDPELLQMALGAFQKAEEKGVAITH